MEPSTLSSILQKAQDRLKSRRSPLAQGFTLIELLVVVAIIGILTIIILLSQRNFNSATLLTDTAYTLALSIRESQSFGISSRNYSGIYNAGYGVHFGNTANSYVVFADTSPASPGTNSTYCPEHTEANPSLPDARPGNCYYDSGDGLVQTYTLGGGYAISKIVGVPTASCSNSTDFSPGAGTLDIVYERPNTQAVITMNNATCPLSSVAIDITSPQGGLRCVIVNSLGEVSVSSSCSL